jgi:1-deoxy-D-xylulose-5-phosphate synthase
MVREAVSVHDCLAQEGIQAAVVNCSTVKPLDEDVLRLFSDRPLFTMEEHVLTGGFGSEVTVFLVGEELPPPLITFGLPDTFMQHGSRGQLLRYLGMMPEQMTRRILVALRQHGQSGQTREADHG